MDAFASNPWLAGLAGVTSAVTVVGNAAVLAAVATRRNLRAVRSNLFIASMGESVRLGSFHSTIHNTQGDEDGPGPPSYPFLQPRQRSMCWRIIGLRRIPA